MGPPVRGDWLDTQSPAANTRAGYLAFFGLADPCALEDLAKNVAAKRGYWRRRDQSTNKGGRETAQKVLKAIQDISEALDNGALADVAVGEAVMGGPAELPADVEEALELLVGRGELPRAVRWARERMLAGSDPIPAGRAYLYAVDLYLASGRVGLDDGAINEAKRVGRFLADRDPSFTRNWDAYMSVLERTGDVGEMFAMADKMYNALGYVTPTVGVSVLSATFGDGPIDEWISRLVRFVDSHPDDLALRAQLVLSVARRGLPRILPISDAVSAERYRRYVSALAWAADSIFEAEIALRPHRLWAARCTAPMNPSDPTYRTLLAAATGGLYLLWSARRCKPAWALYVSREPREQAAAQGLRDSEYIRDAHALEAEG
jgi:hypothetical protein